MRITNPSHRVYLATGATDLRASIDGLSLKVSHAFNLDPFDTSYFVFCNRSKNKLKILVWEHNGFWLYYKRVDKGRFFWPDTSRGTATISLSGRELNWILDGLSLDRTTGFPPETRRTLS